jgi:hypothetical protein
MEHFMDYDLGFFDKEGNRIDPVGENPSALIASDDKHSGPG